MAKTLSDNARNLIARLGGKTTISRKSEDGTTTKQVFDGVPQNGSMAALVALAKKADAGIGVGAAINGAKVSSSAKGATGDASALLAYQILMNDPNATEVPASFLATLSGTSAPATLPTADRFSDPTPEEQKDIEAAVASRHEEDKKKKTSRNGQPA